MKKLPIGIQSFSELRNGGYLYIDKTEQIFQLANQGKYYFLSRPRRFGKSLLVSTLSELFKGNKSLFEDLWIYDRWDWDQTQPIIHLSMNSLGYKEIGLEKALTIRLDEIADSYGLKLTKEPNSLRLRELINGLNASLGQVVILIDEYDKPILDYLDDLPRAEQHREQLKSFYSVLKDADPHLRLVLLTGVSKFSRVSIFSELNNLKDLTMHPQYNTLLGYTQEELEFYFADRLDALATRYGGREKLLSQIKQWYNGYNWDSEQYVYNPFSILSFFDQGRFRNFWFETGTPTFLVKLLERERFYNLDQIRVDEAVFSTFELDRIDPNALLFQTGYITILSNEDYPTYTLSYPNQEVRDSLLRYLLAEYSRGFASAVPVKVQQMKKMLEADKLWDFVQVLNSLFASIPHQIFIADKEAFYHAVTFLALSLMDTYIQAEVSQANGRPDAVVYTESTIYILEFKLDKSAEEALNQIKDKNYAAPYLDAGKKVKAIGFNFSSQQKAIDHWLEEVVG